MHIDWWTLALQTVNVLVLIWILSRFFFRPIMDIVARRQEEASRVLTDAAKSRQDADAARADAEKARDAIGKERDRLIAEAQKTAKTAKDEMLAQASNDIAKRRSEAEAAMTRDRAAADEAVIARASDLSVDIGRRLLERLPPGTAFDAFLEGLCRELKALPAETRESLASATTAGHPIEIVTAAPVPDADIDRVRGALTDAFGAPLPLEFRSDPDVIAGIELHGRNTIVRNSWRGDLGRIREELSRVRPSGKP